MRRYTAIRTPISVRMPSGAVMPLAIPIGEPGGALTIAETVGVLGVTSITMVPADLTVGPRADVTAFTIVRLNAGAY